MNPRFDHIGKSVQEFPELFFHIDIPISITEAFNPIFMMFITDMLDTKHFRPVNGIDHKRPADSWRALHMIDLLQEHGPACRPGEPGHIHVIGAAFRINEYRVREPGSKRGLADPFRSIHHYFFGFFDPASGNLHPH